MLLAEIFKPDSVLCNAHARSKKHCLEILSELLVRPIAEVGADDIFGKLVERERIGSTSMTEGVAFPRCRLDGIDYCQAALVKLSEPVDFDSATAEPVDLVFGLIVPLTLTDEDYADIDLVTNLIADEALRERLRAARSSTELHATLVAGRRAFEPGKLKAAEGR
jgi:PTS system nitrogen regulatory IIA component